MTQNIRPLVKTDYAPINGAQLYYEMLGAGHPLVLIHGGQLDHRMWDEQFHAFAQYCQVIRYDVRDHGLSNALCPPGPFADHEDLLGLLDYLGINQAAVMGLSLGGIIAIDFTLAHPDKVSALLTISAGLSGYNAPSPQALENTNKMVKAWEAGDMEGVVEFFQHSWTDGPYRTPAQVDPGVRQRVCTMALERIKQGAGKGERQPLTPPALERLGEIHAPTLTVVGDLDMPDILAISDLLVEKIAGADRVIMNAVAHMVNMEQPAEFNQIVLDFLGRNGLIEHDLEIINEYADALNAEALDMLSYQAPI